MITHILVKPIDTLAEPIVGGLDLLTVLKIKIFTFCFIWTLGKTTLFITQNKISTPQNIFANMCYNNNSNKVI